jgi:superfamily II DNA helicase RecQ
MATAALGPSFNYPSVRWVVHVSAPWRIMDFAQESGRARQDRLLAKSMILLPAGWRVAREASAAASPAPSPDKKAMQLYLLGQYCLQGMLS